MNINYEILEKNLSTNKELDSIYLLYGNERYLIENIVKKIKKNFGELILGINFIIIDETSISDLITNIEMPAFGYDKKLIVVKNSGLFKKDGRKKELTEFQKRFLDYISNNFSIIQEMSNIVFVEEEVDKNKIFDEIIKVATVCEINELKLNQLIARLKKICLLYNVNVDDSTLNYLIEVSRNKFTNFD